MEKMIDLHTVDGDNRKVAAVRNLVNQFPTVISYWHASGITERTETSKHKHGVLAHQLGSAMFAEGISSLLTEKGVLNGDQAKDITQAALLHDADKTTDMKFILSAMGGRDGESKVSWEQIEEIINATDLKDKDRISVELRVNFAKYFKPGVDVGERVHVARALVAGKIHKERLRAAGFFDSVIAIQGATEYTGCDEVDYLIDNYPNLTPNKQTLVIQKVVMSFVDNCMMESEAVDPKIRAQAVFKKSINIALSQAWTKWNSKAETAEEKQIRVAYKEQAFLANLLGIDSNNFLAEIEANMQNRLASNQ